MKRYRRLLIGLGIALMPAAALASAFTPANTQSVAGIPFTALDAFAQTEVADRLPETRAPGAMIVIVDKEGNRYTRAFGTLGPDDRTPLDTPTHLFRIASETKVITALAILQLVEAGRVSLDDDIEKHLGGLRLKPEGGAPITIRDLLQHRAGISNIPMVGSGLRDARDHPLLKDYLAKHAPKRLRPPGDGIAYTNGAYTLLGRIIETASGETYETYIDAHIFKPLGMDLARFPGASAAPVPIAQGVYVSPSGVAPFPAVDTKTRPSGDAMMTAHEMGNFLLMMLNGGQHRATQVIPGKAIDALYSDCWSADPVFGGRCLGPTRILRAGTPIYMHGGDYFTSLSSWYVLPEQGIAFWVGNTSSIPIDNDVFEAFLAKFYPALATANAPKSTGPIETDIAGTYRVNSQSMSGSGRFFELLMPGSELLVAAQTDGISVSGRRYVRIAPDLFQMAGPPAIDGDTLRFRRDASGKVFELHTNARSATRISAIDTVQTARIAFGVMIAGLAILFLFTATRTLLALKRGGQSLIPALSAATGLLLLAGVAAAISLPAAGPMIMFGFPPLFRAAQSLWMLGGVAAVAAIMALLRCPAPRIDRVAASLSILFAAAFVLMLFRWEFL